MSATLFKYRWLVAAGLLSLAFMLFFDASVPDNNVSAAPSSKAEIKPYDFSKQSAQQDLPAMKNDAGGFSSNSPFTVGKFDESSGTPVALDGKVYGFQGLSEPARIAIEASPEFVEK